MSASDDRKSMEAEGDGHARVRPAPLGRRRASWAMLPRVMAIMLAGVLAVQFANFALLQFVPLPQPPITTVGEVASMLRHGYRGREYRISISSAVPTVEHGRALGLSAGIAKELGTTPQAVRLSFIDPPAFGRRPRLPISQHSVADRDALLVGDFTASWRRPDGRWLSIMPSRSGIAAWRLGLLFWLVVAVVTVLPFAWLLARWVTRPIAVFADAAERIGRNPYTEPMVVDGPSEIAHVAGVMNEMQARLTRFVDDRTLMIGAIAHDLRTPLMRLSLRLETAPDALRQGVDRDVADMQAMIAAATRYVRGATVTGTRTHLDLRSLAETAVDDMADRGDAVSITPGEHVIVDGDPVALRSVFDNLLTNAMRYAGGAEVSVREEAGVAVIEVRDRGPGLAAQDLQRVFEPFFRAEQSRNRETGGLGLGLASVRGVVRLHGGDATIANHPGGGLLVRLTLPV